MKVVLSKPYAEFVKERIEDGVYENASEAVRDALRQMSDRVYEHKVAALRRSLQEGLDSGIDENFSFAALNAELDAQLMKPSKRRAASKK